MRSTAKQRAPALAWLVIVVVSACAPGSAVSPNDDGPHADRRGGEEETDGGLGGTGILGEITGFGSVIVNGVRVETAPTDTVASVLGPAPAATLELGEIVIVRAKGAPDALRAETLARYIPVVGPISAIDHGARRLTMIGVDVSAPADVRVRDQLGRPIDFAQLNVGDHTAVSGFWNGEIVMARHIRVVPGDAPESVTGAVERGESGALSIGGVPIATDAATPDAVALTGLGVYRDGALEAASFAVETATPLAPGVSTLSVQGYPVRGGGNGDAFVLSGDPGVAVATAREGRLGVFEGVAALAAGLSRGALGEAGAASENRSGEALRARVETIRETLEAAGVDPDAVRDRAAERVERARANGGRGFGLGAAAAAREASGDGAAKGAGDAEGAGDAAADGQESGDRGRSRERGGRGPGRGDRAGRAP